MPPPNPKAVKCVITLRLNGGEANPGPPIGPALSQHKVNSMQFVKEYNDRTAQQKGEVAPAVITIYQDGSFTFTLKSSPTSVLIKKELGLEKASSNPGVDVAAEISAEQLKRVAEVKMGDLNTDDIESAMKVVAGSARSMGIKVAGAEDA